MEDLTKKLLQGIKKQYSAEGPTLANTEASIELAGFGNELKEKWSNKYKKSIDCNNPKGFSQKAHCQGKKKKETKEATGSGSAGGYEGPLFSEPSKKVETKEATGASSAGQYSGPAFGAKSMSPKDWRGASKTQIPGGSFVQVKKKCKTFPYCNQGDINALKITKNTTIRKKAKKLSEQYGVDESIILKLIVDEIRKNH